MHIKKSVPSPQLEQIYGENYSCEDLVCLRFSDDKTPIPICGYTDGQMWGTISENDKDRDIEFFWVQETEFSDDFKYCTDSDAFALCNLFFSRGVIKTDDAGAILPYATVNRAEICDIVIKFLGCTTKENPQIPFNDIAAESPYYKSIAIAYENGIVKGTTNETFEPNKTITREELVVIVARVAQFLDLIDVSEPTSYSLSNYHDAEEVSLWALPSYKTMDIHLIYDMEYISKYDENIGQMHTVLSPTLNPQKTASKYEVLKLLYNILEINLTKLSN